MRKISTAQKPSDDELNGFYKSLSDCKPECLSLVHPSYLVCFISKTRNIKCIADLFDQKYLELSYLELLQECNKVDVKLSDQEIDLIEKETIDQAKGRQPFSRKLHNRIFYTHS